MPSLYEAFATVNGDERRRPILLPSHVPESSPPIPDQVAFAAPFSSRPGGNRPPPDNHRSYIGGNRPFFQHCHTIDRYFDLHPKLKQLLHHQTLITQAQIAQLQSHMGIGASSSSSGPTAAIVAGNPIALHGMLAHPT